MKINPFPFCLPILPSPYTRYPSTLPRTFSFKLEYQISAVIINIGWFTSIGIYISTCRYAHTTKTTYWLIWIEHNTIELLLELLLCHSTFLLWWSITQIFTDYHEISTETRITQAFNGRFFPIVFLFFFFPPQWTPLFSFFSSTTLSCFIPHQPLSFSFLFLSRPPLLD